MRICIVGSEKVWSIDRLYFKYLVEEGQDASMFPAHDIFYDYYYKSVFNKLRYRAGVSRILEEINSSFLQFVETVRPDIVWIFKGMEIFAETLATLKSQGVFLVNYNPDNPFFFSGKGSGNKNISESIRHYDLFFTYDDSIAKRLEEEFGKPVEMLPFGYEMDDAAFDLAEGQDEIVKLCFLGNPDKHRAAFVLALSEKMKARGGHIDVIGNHWKRFLPQESGIEIFPPVYSAGFWSALRRYRVQLNMMRPHNQLSHNMRSFEIPAVGGIMLTPDTPDHARFFTDGKNAFLYSGVEDAADKAMYLLRLSKQEADRIRLEARNTSIRSGHSYKARSLQALKGIKKHFEIDHHA